MWYSIGARCGSFGSVAHGRQRRGYLSNLLNMKGHYVAAESGELLLLSCHHLTFLGGGKKRHGLLKRANTSVL